MMSTERNVNKSRGLTSCLLKRKRGPSKQKQVGLENNFLTSEAYMLSNATTNLLTF